MAASTVQAKPGSGSDPAFVGASLTSPATGFGPSATIVLTDGTNGEFLNPGQQTKAHSVPTALASDQESLSRCNGSVAVAAITVTTTAGKLGTGVSAVPLTGRKRWRIRVVSGAAIFLGPSGVTSSSGLKIDVGGSDELELGPSVDMYGITASGTADVRVMELA